ncbi:transposase [Nonomuraea sp. B12E4]|uniref:transposase n=1 Tax=Nonomuraea sp. B12E4 TaxID=3153564 RepID=UPI00325D75F5
MPRRSCRSNLSDARWALIEPTLTAWRAARRVPGVATRAHDLREIVNAISYGCRAGCRSGTAWPHRVVSEAPEQCGYGARSPNRCAPASADAAPS